MLMLHGFPQFWYAFRHQMLALADAGYRAAAMDLRGYGASDKPPRGYDTYMGGRDAAAVVRALGARDAVIVGQGLGGFIAWAMPTFQAETTRAIASLSMSHPRVFRHAVYSDREQLKASKWILDLQIPFAPERAMEKDPSYVEGLLRSWSSPLGEWPAPEDVERYAAGMALPFVGHSAAEHYRWFGRSQLRPDGPMFMRRIRRPLQVPVLQLHGDEDTCVLPSAGIASERYCAKGYDLAMIDGAGHFLAEEAPAQVNRHLISWLDSL